MDVKQLPSRDYLDWMARARARLTGATGTSIRELQARGALAGVPVEILVAFTAPASATGNTTDARSGKGAAVAFHEIGYWQVPAGPADRGPDGVPRGPAPNPDPRAPDNTWGRLAHDPRVRALLGDRDAVMAPGAWKTAILDQHAIGMTMLADDYATVRAWLQPAIRPTAPGTPWGTALMFTAFSAGPAGAARLVTHFAAALNNVSEERRWGALVAAVALELQAGWEPGGTPDTHSNPVHRVLRTWQKFEFAKALCAETGNHAGYFDAGLGAAQPAYEMAILRGNWKLPPLGGLVAPDFVSR